MLLLLFCSAIQNPVQTHPGRNWERWCCHYSSPLKQGGISNLYSTSNYRKAFGSFEVRSPSADDVAYCSMQTRFPRDVRIPAPVNHRGRPGTLRKKSFTEESRAAANRRTGLSAATRGGVMCGICGQFGHNMRSCPLIRFDSTCED